MGNMGTHRDLVVWQAAMDLVEMVYRATAAFPKEEIYGLTAQTRRSAVSVPVNIAEGACRNSSRELFQYLGIATGSLAELETELELAIRLRYLPQDVDALAQARRVGRLANALRTSIRKRMAGGHEGNTPHQSR